jgi:hypothetical protein
MIEHLYRALATPFGTTVLTNNPRAAKSKLYQLRSSRSEFGDLTITESPINPSAELWIYRKSARKEQEK